MLDKHSVAQKPSRILLFQQMTVEHCKDRVVSMIRPEVRSFRPSDATVTISEWNEEIVLLYGQNERAFDSVTTVFPNAWELSGVTNSKHWF